MLYVLKTSQWLQYIENIYVSNNSEAFDAEYESIYLLYGQGYSSVHTNHIGLVNPLHKYDASYE